MAVLKRLTLRNFKSFKTAVIPFAEGFTAIMGPNGSGKSNIIDAIIFVLGEGRLRLVRASRLRDLVNVKAKDGEALVSLDIEADGKTYTITRSINRKGQSVYRLNGKRVARHEIISLLSSLGISQRGYNFVLQGEITRLIKMTPLERRAIIDEIAGISEYEERKEEALKKLDAVSERIKEVSIVLGEREERLKVLEREREEALKYLELKEYTASLRKGLLLRDIKRMEVRISEIASELERKRMEAEDLKNERFRLEEELRVLEERSRELTRRISELYGGGEGAYNELLREKERVEADIKHARVKLSELEAERIRIVEELENLEREIKSLETKIESVLARRAEKDEEVNALRQRIRSLEELIRREREEEFALQRKVEEIGSQITSLKEEYARLREEYGRLLGEYNARLEEQKKRKEKLEKKRREMEELRKRLEEVERELREAEEEKKDVLEREKRLNREYLTLQEEVKALREELGALRGATLVLKNLGVSTEVINALLDAQRKGELRGIKGYVASLIRYDKKYRRALEAAAGRRLFYIVVETAEDAVEAIKFLKRNGLGRATFIPLDRVKPRVVEAPQAPGVIGRALDLVDYDPTVKRAMEYVFGDSVVVDTIDRAKRMEGNFRIVTLDGDVVERSGVISGGSVRGESVLQLFEAEKKRGELREKEFRLKEVISELQEVRKVLERLNRRIAELHSKREGIKARLDEETEEEVEDLEELKRKVEETSERMTELANRISDLEMERSRLVSQVRKSGSDLLEQLNMLRREYDAKLQELHEYDSLLREKRTRLDSLKEQRDLRKSRLSLIEEERVRTKERLDTLEERLNSLNEEITKLEEEMKRNREELEKLIAEKERLDEELGKVSRRLGGINSRLTSVERDIAVLERELGMLKSQLEEVRGEYEEIGAEPLDPLPPEPEKLLREKIEEMRTLEPVNLKAIEEYEEMKRKVEEVKEKIRKLEEERKAILDMINEIEKRKREVFMETFRGLARKFEEVYRDLAGGRARLRLTDDKDVFNAGLIIEATPKGKSLTHMDALSGGEKAMVALAFIFATAMFRPAPFYVLDEPDLMLDKVNAEKMARYIKRLSKTAQFIIVSHRDVVLKEADQIIGVYLGRDGSSVVEVRVPQAAQASSGATQSS